jgi:uracil phosphoribosyltransferase
MSFFNPSGFPDLYVSQNQLLQARLTTLRDKNTTYVTFRDNMNRIGAILAAEVLGKLPCRTVKVETPLAVTQGLAMPERAPAIVTILRAGLGLSRAFEDMLPEGVVGHIGLYRDAETHMPCEYVLRLPDLEGRTVYLMDPMLATGNSLLHALDLLKANGAGDIKIVALLASPEGVRTVHGSYPGVPIYTGALDDHLNDHAYIVPGLGDAGDRYFGTAGHG